MMKNDFEFNQDFEIEEKQLEVLGGSDTKKELNDKNKLKI